MADNSTSAADVCPPGYDCTTYRRGFEQIDRIPCSEGFLCLPDNAPRRCQPGFYCPPGGTQELPYFFFGGVILIALGALALFVLYRLFRIYEARFRYHGTFGKIQDEGGYNESPSAGRRGGYDIAFEDLGYSARGRPILSGLHGRFGAGGVHGLLGPSGAGKTVLLRLLAGRLEPTAGRLLVNGRERSLAKHPRRVGYVPQDDVMIRDLTVMEARVPPNLS
eukprot:tig00021036_g17337.t1